LVKLDKQILWLEITMHDSKSMQVTQTKKHLAESRDTVIFA
jgi:hypothetical protein